MKPTGAAALALLLSALPTSATPPGARSESRAAKEVAAAEQAWSDAFLRHDLGALSRILAEEFVGIDGRGMVSDKTGELEEAKAPPADRPPERALVDEELSDVRVRVYGNAAVLTAINKATFRGKDADSVIRYRRTTVWVKRNGRWQCVSFHGSRIMEPPKPD